MSEYALLSPPLTEQILERSAQVLQKARESGQMLVTAESCTAGLLAAALTFHAGSSDVVAGGFVTYSNAMKTALLGVTTATLERFGAVSSETVSEMAAGARNHAPGLPVSLSISGIAGPGGGSVSKPVGLVWFGSASARGIVTDHKIFPGDRTQIRSAAVLHALNLLHNSLET